ncbi:metal-sensing transcriptional repressor [Sporosarcina sp. FSL K6-1508]|uniref:metal-sensing transcriptional repressor n=1 Tax=Sporosarcina sp. FSL K6-1508 TaxID=2921553 RepID=UPI0030F52BBA
MTQNERDHPDILLQIVAVRKALDNTAEIIFSDFIEGCIINAVHEGYEKEVIKDIKKTLDHYIC